MPLLPLLALLVFPHVPWKASLLGGLLFLQLLTSYRPGELNLARGLGCFGASLVTAGALAPLYGAELPWAALRFLATVPVSLLVMALVTLRAQRQTAGPPGSGRLPGANPGDTPAR